MSPGPRRGDADIRFTLRQLRCFVAVAEEGGVTAAAERLALSPSSVSAAVAQLEQALGLDLLIRHHARGVTPTRAGERVLAEARDLLMRAGALGDLAGELAAFPSGPLAIGCLVTLAPVVLPGLLASFLTRFPAVEPQFHEADQSALLELLARGRIDLALTYDLGLDDRVDFAPLRSLPPHVLFGEDHPLAGRKRVALGELAGHGYVLLDLPLSREYFAGLFAEAGVEPRIVARSPHFELVRSLVANGFGYTLANIRPGSGTAGDGRRLVAVELDGAARALALGLAMPRARPRSQAVRAFVEHAAELAAGGRLPGATEPRTL